MSGPPANVYVVDDDQTLRQSVMRLFEEAGFQVQVFASGEAILSAYAKLSPGSIILDMFMPQMDGLELHRRLIAAGCRWPIILLTGHASRPVLDSAMEAGIIAFLEKPVREVELLAAVMRGQAHLSGKAEIIPDTELVERISRLTSREQQVLVFLMEGQLNKQMAAVLGIRETTVKGYRRGLAKKLGARSTTELLMLGLRSGLYKPPKRQR
jgi:two-component system, LuxR family, response regulator FixJ